MDVKTARKMLERLREDPERVARSEADEEFEEIAPATLAALILAVEALEEKDAADRHVLFCEACDSGALNFCMAGQDMINAAAGTEAKALAAWRAL